MQLALTVSGIILWILIALVLVSSIARRRLVRKILTRPGLYPYTHYFEQKLSVRMTQLRRALNLIPSWMATPELLRSRRSVKLEHLKELRDAYLEVDKLPTIEGGKLVLGIGSIFDVATERYRFGETDISHPLQNPPFFLPGVPAKAFYDPYDFEWTRPLEEAFPVIKKELLALLEEEAQGFQSYVNEFAGVQPGWNTFNFFFFGKKFEENCARCPETTKLLEALPRFEKDHIMFSALNPHSAIPPHYGPMNGILRAHLPLIVPEGCYIKVGGEEQQWEEGKVMVFDDSFLHQVWNHSDQLRIVLFLNFWHPCFSEEEIPVLEKFRTAYEKHPVAAQHAHNQNKKRSHSIKKLDAAVKKGEPVVNPA